MTDMVERVARAIYDAVDPLSGDRIATVIVTSEHLFPKEEHYAGNPTSQAYQLAAMEVCRTAARAAIEAMREPIPAMVEAEDRVGDERLQRLMQWADEERGESLLQSDVGYYRDAKQAFKELLSRRAALTD